MWCAVYMCLFQIPWGMFLPRIGKIGWHLTKLWLIPIKYHAELLAKQYWLSCYPIAPSVSSSHHSACPSEKHEGHWRAHWWSITARLYLSQMKTSQMLTLTVTVYVLSTAKQKQKRILYQTESLELHHPISHLLKVCCLGQSIPLSPSCVLVTVGFWSVTRPASPVAYQMSVRSVEWHHIP